MNIHIPSTIPKLETAQWRLIVRYGAFFLGCFLISLYLTFPREVLRDFIIQKVEQQPVPNGGSIPTGYAIELDEVDTYWLSGLQLSHLKITKSPRDPGDPPMVIAFDELVARVSIWNALFGNKALSFSGEIGGGSLDGYVRDTGGELNLELDMDELDIAQVLPNGVFGLPIRGVATSEIDLTFSSEASSSGGEADLTIRELSVGDGKSQLKIPGLGMGMAMDKTRFGNLEIKVASENGNAKFARFVAKGPDALLGGSGKMTLIYPMVQSQTDLLLKFKFTDAYRNKHEWVNGLYALMDFNPMLKSARTADNGIQYRLEGAFKSLLRTTPAGNLPAPPGI